jgi:hypothetical protein
LKGTHPALTRSGSPGYIDGSPALGGGALHRRSGLIPVLLLLTLSLHHAQSPARHYRWSAKTATPPGPIPAVQASITLRRFHRVPFDLARAHKGRRTPRRARARQACHARWQAQSEDARGRRPPADRVAGLPTQPSGFLYRGRAPPD